MDIKFYAKKFRKEKLRDETFYEKAFRKHLKGLRYVAQKVIYVNNRTKFYIADFYIPKYKTVIEIDGSQHSEEIIKLHDEKRTQELKEAGVRKVIRFTNYEVINLPAKKIRDILLVNLLA